MKEKRLSKKLGIAALIVNICAVLATVFVEIVLYNIVSYKDYIVLEYLPIKYIIFAEIILVVLVIIPFVIKWGKKSAIASIVMSAVLTVALVVVGILGVVYNGEIKDKISTTEKTLDKIVENSQLATDEYGVYVLKDDGAEKLSDVADYNVGYCLKYASDDTTTVVNSIESELGKVIKKQKIDDPSHLADALLNGQVKAIILNQSLIDTIKSAGDDDNNGKLDGTYAKFDSKIKCIYSITVKNALAAMSDPGNVTKRCFNVYISGIDTEGDVTVKSRSDVNIIMSVNPLTHRIILISTPRDCYVPLSISNGVKDKLTHAGIYGIDVSMKTLEMLYDIKFDYYVRMNFTGFVDIIDALGGVDVQSDYDFSTHGHSYHQGLNENLSGIEALWFARERHAFADGDHQRGRDQMKVIEAVIKKCQSTALLNNYDKILSDVSKSFQTNMNKDSIKSLVKFQLNIAPSWKVTTYSITGRGASEFTYSVPSKRAYVMYPDESTIDAAKKMLSQNKNNKKVKEVTEKVE